MGPTTTESMGHLVGKDYLGRLVAASVADRNVPAVVTQKADEGIHHNTADQGAKWFEVGVDDVDCIADADAVSFGCFAGAGNHDAFGIRPQYRSHDCCHLSTQLEKPSGGIKLLYNQVRF